MLTIILRLACYDRWSIDHGSVVLRLASHDRL